MYRSSFSVCARILLLETSFYDDDDTVVTVASTERIQCQGA